MSKRVSISDLAIGDFVEQLEGVFWQDTDPADFPMQSLMIRTDADIERVAKYGCRYVLLRDEVHKNINQAAPVQASAFVKRLSEASKTYHAIRAMVLPMHRTIRAGRPINVGGISAGLARIVPKIVRNNDALMWLTNLDKKDDSLVRHSVNVCLLALVFGKHLGLRDAELQDLAMGALLHDIGKLKISRRLLTSKKPLSGRDLEEMNKHVDLGVELLQRCGKFNSRVESIVRLHHENFDGNGFPQGATLDQPEHRMAQIVCVVDAYDELVRTNGGKTASRAIELMREQRGKKFHAGLLDAFFDCVGDLPVGNFLELSTGEIGIELAKSTGVFLVFFDSEKRRLPAPKIVGLKFQGRIQSGLRIRRMLLPDEYGLDFNDCINRAANC